MAGADFVHECIDEKLDSKRAMFVELDRLARPSAILATTTSSFPVSTFAAELPSRARCIVVHPATPPHLLPVTEICPAPFTDPSVTDACFALMERCRQVPVLIRFEQSSFVLNRMQAALVAEAFRLVRDGVMSVEDVDACVRDGLGLRWSFMGPFETIDLNAPGGVADYAARFGPLLGAITAEQAPYDFDAATVEKVAAERRAALPSTAIEDRSAWRDRRLMALLAHRRSQPG